MSFFSKIGKAITKGVKSVAKAVGTVAQTAAPIAALVPGIGAPIAAGLSIVGGVLGPKGQIQPAVDQALAYLQPPAAPVQGPPAAAASGGFSIGTVAAIAALFFLGH